MTLAAVDVTAIAAAPIAFVTGLLIGFWLGARFDLRKKADVNGRRQ